MLSIEDKDKRQKIIDNVELYLDGNISCFKVWLRSCSKRDLLLTIKALDMYQVKGTAINIILNLLD